MAKNSICLGNRTNCVDQALMKGEGGMNISSDMLRLISALIISASIILSANAQDEVMKQAQAVFSPLPSVMESADNPVTPEKIALGKMLFYDTRISVDRTVSCFKCHWINLYGTDGLQKSIGNHYKENPRNAPTVFNAAGEISEHWIGNRKSVEDQAKQALLGAGSYGLASYDEAEAKLKAIPGYDSLFAKAFPDDKNPVNVDNFALAIGAWERTLVTPSRFDSYLKGDSSALSVEEKAGLKTFMELGCIQCHSGTYVGGEMYQKFGITEPYWNLTNSQKIDEGRFIVTKDESDKYVFKVPVLRNVEMTAPYFHDGSVGDLNQAVRIMARLQLGRTLDDNQAESLVTFLKSLTGSIPPDALTVPILPAEN